MPKEGKNLRVSKILAQEILDWCIVRYGKSKHFDDYPELEFVHIKGFFGAFNDNDNIIEINVSKHLSTKRWKTMFCKMGELAKTIIHEYTHYMQSPVHAERFSKKYTYDDNPYEKKAELIANGDNLNCITDITLKRKNESYSQQQRKM